MEMEKKSVQITFLNLKSVSFTLHFLSVSVLGNKSASPWSWRKEEVAFSLYYFLLLLLVVITLRELSVVHVVRLHLFVVFLYETVPEKGFDCCSWFLCWSVSFLVQNRHYRMLIGLLTGWKWIRWEDLKMDLQNFNLKSSAIQLLSKMNLAWQLVHPDWNSLKSLCSILPTNKRIDSVFDWSYNF